MKTILFIAFFFPIVLSANSQGSSFDYFGLPSPGNKIELFVPGIISLENSKEYALAISPLGNEVFFAIGTWPECKIMHVKKNGNQWSKAKIADFSAECYAVEPAFSPDGKYLYFSSSKGMKDIKQYCIWRLERVGNQWGKAKKVIDIEEPNISEFHPSITNDGTVYFCAWDLKKNKGSIYKSKNSNGIYSEPVEENVPFNGDCSVTNPFVDPDGKFIITSTEIENSKNKYDAFISYREEDGWAKPVNFGDRFNSSEVDDSFDVSPDGRFLFIYKQDNVYWTERKGVIQ
jgi:Tol biopolymer transport system component